MDASWPRFPGWRRVLDGGLLALIVVTVALAAYPLVRTGGQPAAPSAPGVCGAATGVRGQCLFFDRADRLPLSARQLTELGLLTENVGAEVARLSVECGPSEHGGSPPQGGNECVQTRAVSPVSVRFALMQLGFLDAVVRVAAPADPAPPHTVIYAVHVGPGCLLGFVGSVSATWLAGPLLTGACLPTP
jgi:hypothetical protein